jgi:hypothetical protein
MSRAYYTIPIVDEYDTTNMTGRTLLIPPAETGDDDQVTRLREACGSAVQANLARVSLRGQCIRFEPGAVINIPYMNRLKRENTGFLQQSFVDRDTTLVIEIGTRHNRPVDFGSHYLN